MKYAVIDISGRQAIVSENETLVVDKIDAEENSELSTDKVLLLVDEDKVQVGKPLVKKALVKYQVVKHHKGKKLDIFKYKAKSRYRKTMGFRPQLTDILVTKIEITK